MKIRIFILSLFLFSFLWSEEITLGSWNIEHLGSPGRGLGYRDLPRRNSRDLRKIAQLIEELDLSVLALQEVAITGFQDNQALSEPLDELCRTLGEDWRYIILGDPADPPGFQSVHNMQNSYIWDSSRVHLLSDFPLQVVSVEVGQKRTFDRIPYAAWFETYRGNDFLLINLHLSSGQDNDENHLAAMVMVEQSINKSLRALDITESDRIILGDFNDNPWAVDDRGRREYSDLLYRYMEEKGYSNLMNEEFAFTRINNHLNSRIDHVLINRSALRHYREDSFQVYYPEQNLEELQKWRETYSDHLPLLFQLKTGTDDDAD